VARLLATTLRTGLCRMVELDCLTRAQCHQLVAAILPASSASRELLDRVYELSRGNPMFVRELVSEIRARGQAGDAAGETWGAALMADHVPRPVRIMAATRLASLDATVRRILLLAAAGGGEISLADLRAGAAALDPPVGEGPLLDALDRALELRLLEERRTGYAFRHPLMRSALYGRLSRHRRAQLGNAMQHSGA
jgi:predicted ATPase